MSNISRITLFKRFNSIWYILYYIDGIQRWKSTGCTIKSDALIKLSEFQVLLKEKTRPKRLSEFTNEFIPFAKDTYARATVDIFVIGLRHLQDVAGNPMLSHLTQQHLDLYKAKRIKEVTPTSVNVELRGLRTIMNVAVRWKFLQENPFSKVQLLKIAERTPTYVSKLDFERLLATVKEGWFRELIVLAVLTGMRRGEILNLKWQNIDFQRKLILIESSPSFRVKCGKKRTIPLNEVAYQLLKSRREKSVNEYVFETDGKRFAYSYITRKFKKYVRVAGLTEALHFHSLRHTFATWLIQNGANIYEVQKLLGHSSVQVTEIYSHLLPNELHSTVNKICVSLN